MEFSIVIPIYNDSDLIESFCLNFSKELATKSIPDNSEVIFVEDGSRVKFIGKKFVDDIKKRYSFVRFIKLSRNFGQHTAILTGLRYSSAKYVGFMNVDQEDPVVEIKNILNKIMSTDADLVISLRTSRDRKFLRDASSIFFHRLFNALTGLSYPINCSTLRIYTKQAKELLIANWDQNPYIPGMEKRSGLKVEFLEIKQSPRVQGVSSYTFLKRLNFALTTSISYSAIPLKITIAVGFVVSLIGLVLAANIILSKVLLENYLPGYTSTVALIIFFGGLTILSVGIQGLYVAKIFEGIKNLPLYQVKEFENEL